MAWWQFWKKEGEDEEPDPFVGNVSNDESSEEGAEYHNATDLIDDGDGEDTLQTRYTTIQETLNQPRPQKKSWFRWN